MTESSSPQPQKPNLLQRLGPKGIAAIVLGVLVIVFIVENDSKTHIRFIAGSKVSAPLWLALLIAGGVGALVGWLVEKRRSKD